MTIRTHNHDLSTSQQKNAAKIPDGTCGKGDSLTTGTNGVTVASSVLVRGCAPHAFNTTCMIPTMQKNHYPEKA
jgi:hypothetical protein